MWKITIEWPLIRLNVSLSKYSFIYMIFKASYLFAVVINAI
jgi:hypothetical protein